MDMYVCMYVWVDSCTSDSGGIAEVVDRISGTTSPSVVEGVDNINIRLRHSEDSVRLGSPVYYLKHSVG